MTDTNYNRSCINSAECSANERIAAIYDYIGAVYGKFADAKYDNILTQKERDEVEKQFGKLANVGNIVSYLTAAKTKYFSGIRTTVGCHDELFSVDRFSNKTYGTGVVLGVEHGCPKNVSNRLSSNNLELEFAANPDKWIFFVEGTAPNQGPEGRGVDLEDINYLKRIAAKLQIPVYDPIIPAWDDRVIEKANEALGTSRVELATYFVVNQLAMIKRELGDQLMPDGTMNYVVNQWASMFKVNPSDIAKFFIVLAEKPESERAEIMSGAIAESEQVLFVCAQISNVISIIHIREVLSKNPSRNNAFYMVGAYHKSIGQLVYQIQ